MKIEARTIGASGLLLPCGLLRASGLLLPFGLLLGSGLFGLLLPGCAGGGPEPSTAMRIVSSPLPRRAANSANSVEVLGRRVDLEVLVRDHEQYPPELLDRRVRRESLFLELPSPTGVLTRSAVLWLPRTPLARLEDRFGLVFASPTPVDDHYLLAWTEAGALVLDLSPGVIRPEVLATAARALSQRYALAPTRVGLDLDATANPELLAVLGPIRNGASFSFGFGLARGPWSAELRELLPLGVPWHATQDEIDPRFSVAGARSFHVQRFQFVQQVLNSEVPLVQHSTRRVLAGSWARLELRAPPNLVELFAGRALDDAERVYAETGSVGAAVDAGLARLRNFGVQSALLQIGTQVYAALGPPDDAEAYAIRRSGSGVPGELAPCWKLRDSALTVVGGKWDPLPWGTSVAVQSTTARAAEEVARTVRSAPDRSAVLRDCGGLPDHELWLLEAGRGAAHWTRIWPRPVRREAAPEAVTESRGNP